MFQFTVFCFLRAGNLQHRII